MNLGNVNQTACQQETPMNIQTRRLSQLVSELQNGIDGLCGKLEPFRNLSPRAGACVEKCPPPAPSSQYVQFLKEQCSQLEMAIMKITSLSQELEV